MVMENYLKNKIISKLGTTIFDDLLLINIFSYSFYHAFKPMALKIKPNIIIFTKILIDFFCILAYTSSVFY
jgi:hypothetical protein